MKIYLKDNVYDRAMRRIRFLFDEFPNIVVNISGGKDSTVVLNLALQIAEEKDRLPLKVMFVDQEAEWQAVIEHIRHIYEDPRIEPYWLQCPLRLYNATSAITPWLECWNLDQKDIWMREKEDFSIHENTFGTDRFKPMFKHFMKTTWPDTKSCYIAGVRAEESPSRFLSLTNARPYKHITWGKTLSKKKQHFTFYPIYDWRYKDVWKAIHDNDWDYCSIYDMQYQYGIGITDMRVSNLHHETAVHSLFYLQEVEPQTWQKLTKRLGGIHTAGILGRENFFYYDQLPFMFKSWIEYRDYLLEKLIIDDELREKYRRQFKVMERSWREGRFKDHVTLDKVAQRCIQSILANDHFFVKLGNVRVAWSKSRRMREREKKLLQEYKRKQAKVVKEGVVDGKKS